MEALAMRHYPMQQGFIEGEARDGCQQPTITYNQYIKHICIINIKEVM